MQILDIIRANFDGERGRKVAEAFHIDRDKVDAVTRGVVDELTYALERNTLNRGGVSDLVETIGHGDHQKFLDGEADVTSEAAQQSGNEILANLLGTKHQSRGVAERVARKSGVDNSIIERMLPAIATVLMGGIEKQTGDKIGEMAQRFTRMNADVGDQQPLPVPGDRADYGRGRSSGRSAFDDLSDMIRKGGYSIPGNGRGHGGVDGREVSRKTRDVFGDLLGFQSNGIISWIIKIVIARYGWRILKSILGRIFR